VRQSDLGGFPQEELPKGFPALKQLACRWTQIIHPCASVVAILSWGQLPVVIAAKKAATKPTGITIKAKAV